MFRFEKAFSFHFNFSNRSVYSSLKWLWLTHCYITYLRNLTLIFSPLFKKKKKFNYVYLLNLASKGYDLLHLVLYPYIIFCIESVSD